MMRTWLTSSVVMVGSLGGPADAERTAVEEALWGAPIASLKNAYLACSGAALERKLDGGEAVVCSTVYETLLRRAFDGDFGRLLKWSRAAHDAHEMPRTPVPPSPSASSAP